MKNLEICQNMWNNFIFEFVLKWIIFAEPKLKIGGAEI